MQRDPGIQFKICNCDYNPWKEPTSSPWKWTLSDIAKINELLSELNPNHSFIDSQVLHRLCSRPDFNLVLILDLDKVVGMGSVVIRETLMGRAATIEDVVLDETLRGMGLGRQIVEMLITLAENQQARYIDLTSHYTRQEANDLYFKMGFRRPDTNVWRLYTKVHRNHRS
jgi:ribosomal protein S18 acetylase RimI-like enzyme